MALGRPLRVLVVDDQPVVASVIGRFLRERRYQVVTALTGVRALRYAATLRPELVILNFSMPELDGLDVLQRLREDPRTETIGVLMTSGLGAVGNRLLQSGANAFLAKPFGKDELLRAVDQVLVDLGLDHYLGAP